MSFVKMLMARKKVPILINRMYNVYIRFGGVVTAPPGTWPPIFDFDGPIRGVSFVTRIARVICADGATRTEVPVLGVVPGAGGPDFQMNDMAPIAGGKNLLEVTILVLSVEETRGTREAASSG
jgi:hypothetical protein